MSSDPIREILLYRRQQKKSKVFINQKTPTILSQKNSAGHSRDP